MSLRVEDFECELAEAQAELDRVRTEVDDLAKREQELRAVVAGWHSIIAARKRSGCLTAGHPASTEIQVEVGDSLQFSDVVEIEDGVNKTKFVRDQILASANRGMSVEDLRSAAKAADMLHPPTWPYGVLSRLKKKGQIYKRRGKYYPRLPAQSRLVEAETDYTRDQARGIGQQVLP